MLVLSEHAVNIPTFFLWYMYKEQTTIIYVRLSLT